MNIYDLMKDDSISTRISMGNRWLIWDNEWVVYEKKYRDKKNSSPFFWFK